MPGSSPQRDVQEAPETESQKSWLLSTERSSGSTPSFHQMTEISSPPEETHFGRLYPWPHSFCLNPEFVTIHSWNVDGLGSLELRLPARFPLLVQCPHYSWCRTNPSVHLKLYFCTICRQDPMILKLLGATTATSNPEWAICPFQQRTMVFGLEVHILISAASHSAANCSSACWRSQTDEPKRITSSAKRSEMNSEVPNSDTLYTQAVTWGSESMNITNGFATRGNLAHLASESFTHWKNV